MIKIDGEDDSKKLGGAVFALRKLTETKAPDGYIRTDNNPVYFRIKDGAVTWIKWSAEEGTWIERTNDPNDNTVTFEDAKAAVQDDPSTDENEAKEAANAAFIIGNTPGSPLPSSGGPGSRFILLLGTVLALTAGGLLILRLRRKYF